MPGQLQPELVRRSPVPLDICPPTPCRGAVSTLRCGSGNRGVPAAEQIRVFPFCSRVRALRCGRRAAARPHPTSRGSTSRRTFHARTRQTRPQRARAQFARLTTIIHAAPDSTGPTVLVANGALDCPTTGVRGRLDGDGGTAMIGWWLAGLSSRCAVRSETCLNAPAHVGLGRWRPRILLLGLRTTS